MYTYNSFKQLIGPRLQLNPLSESDVPEIIKNLYSPTTWAVLVRQMNTPEKLHSYLEGHLAKDRSNDSLTVVARLKANQEVVAISQFHCASPGFKKIEIGYTWVADKWMRTFVNTEKKFLMLQHAFEVMKVKRVEFSVDPNNARSNAAMKRLGCTLEGTLRKWRFLDEKDQGNRNIYSIIDDEWPFIQGHLMNLLS